MDRFELPDDLREIGEHLAQSRAEFTPLELDELHGRLRRRAEQAPRRAPLLRRLRLNSLAGMLSAALLLTTGGGVVLAAGALGGGHTSSFNDPFGSGFRNTFQGTSLKHDRDASDCEYRGPVTHVFTFETPFGDLTVTVTIFCGHVTVHVELDQRDGTRHPAPDDFQWDDGGADQSWNGVAFTITRPGNPTGTITIEIGQGNYTVPLSR